MSVLNSGDKEKVSDLYKLSLEAKELSTMPQRSAKRMFFPKKVVERPSAVVSPKPTKKGNER